MIRSRTESGEGGGETSLPSSKFFSKQRAVEERRQRDKGLLHPPKTVVNAKSET